MDPKGVSELEEDLYTKSLEAGSSTTLTETLWMMSLGPGGRWDDYKEVFLDLGRNLREQK